MKQLPKEPIEKSIEAMQKFTKACLSLSQSIKKLNAKTKELQQ